MHSPKVNHTKLFFFGNFFFGNGVRPDNTQRENLFPFRPVNGSLVKQKIDILLRVIFLEYDSDNPNITVFYGRQVMGIR